MEIINYNHKKKNLNMSENSTFLGDKPESVEKYEAKYNTFDDGGMSEQIQ